MGPLVLKNTRSPGSRPARATACPSSNCCFAECGSSTPSVKYRSRVSPEQSTPLADTPPHMYRLPSQERARLTKTFVAEIIRKMSPGVRLLQFRDLCMGKRLWRRLRLGPRWRSLPDFRAAFVCQRLCLLRSRLLWRGRDSRIDSRLVCGSLRCRNCRADRLGACVRDFRSSRSGFLSGCFKRRRRLVTAGAWHGRLGRRHFRSLCRVCGCVGSVARLLQWLCFYLVLLRCRRTAEHRGGHCQQKTDNSENQHRRLRLITQYATSSLSAFDRAELLE